VWGRCQYSKWRGPKRTRSMTSQLWHYSVTEAAIRSRRRLHVDEHELAASANTPGQRRTYRRGAHVNIAWRRRRRPSRGRRLHARRDTVRSRLDSTRATGGRTDGAPGADGGPVHLPLRTGAALRRENTTVKSRYANY